MREGGIKIRIFKAAGALADGFDSGTQILQMLREFGQGAGQRGPRLQGCADMAQNRAQAGVLRGGQQFEELGKRGNGQLRVIDCIEHDET